jgi:hypothetical protein
MMLSSVGGSDNMENAFEGRPFDAEHADDLAQEVVNVWGQFTAAGHQDRLTPEFITLLNSAIRYRDAKRVANNHRDFNVLTSAEEIEEKESLLAFAQAWQSAHASAAAKKTAAS